MKQSDDFTGLCRRRWPVGRFGDGHFDGPNFGGQALEFLGDAALLPRGEGEGPVEGEQWRVTGRGGSVRVTCA